MKDNDDIPATDTTEIKQLINRVKQGELDQGDAPLIERLLNFLLTIVSLLERKHTSIRRMKELLTSLTVRPAIEPVNGAAYLTFIICRSTLFSRITRWVTSPFSFLTKVIRASTIVRKKMVSVSANSSNFCALFGWII